MTTPTRYTGTQRGPYVAGGSPYMAGGTPYVGARQGDTEGGGGGGGGGGSSNSGEVIGLLIALTYP